jgi:hypothetical protein
MHIIASNAVSFDQLAALPTPAPTPSHTPVPHAALVQNARGAITAAGFEIVQEQHGTNRDGLRYFGGFALRGPDITSKERELVLGLRNSHDKSFAAAICIGTSMLVCENLCFSSTVRLDRKHTSGIARDLPAVFARAMGRLIPAWTEHGERLERYKNTEIDQRQAAHLVVTLAESGALGIRDILPTLREFRAPRHPEFAGPTLFNLYNAATEALKGSDLAKLPSRTQWIQTQFDTFAGGAEAALLALAPVDMDEIPFN